MLSDESPIYEGFELADIIQLIVQNRLSCELIASYQSKKVLGRMYFNQGEPYSAKTANFSGEEAIFEMLSWENGEFEMIEIFPSSIVRKINKTWEQIHLNWSIRMKEFKIVAILSNIKTVTEADIVMLINYKGKVTFSVPKIKELSEPHRLRSEKFIELFLLSKKLHDKNVDEIVLHINEALKVFAKRIVNNEQILLVLFQKKGSFKVVKGMVFQAYSDILKI